MNSNFICKNSLINLLVVASLYATLSGCCPTKNASDERPTAVDHSTTKYFPPIGQQKVGDCTCWSSCYYYNTYTQAKDHDEDASTGNPDVVCSPRFLFSQLCQGTGGAECTEHAMERLSVLGCATISHYPMDASLKAWPGEDARIAALRNRTGQIHKIRVDNAEGLETVKQHIADGGCAVTRGLFRANYPTYGDSASGPGIDNGVMYAKVGGNWLRHSLCICGYDDELSYVDDRDGKTHSGAFLIANSEGQNWGSHNSTGTGTKGFLWVAYNMFMEGEFGLYDHDDNPHKDFCFDNPAYPTIYFHDDLPDYQPSMYAVVGINHAQRNLLSLKAGIGSVDSPDYIGLEVMEQTVAGEIALTDADRVVIDLSEGVHLIKSGKPIQVFFELTVGDAASAEATITSTNVFYAPKGKENYFEYSSKDLSITVMPGKKGYSTVEISAETLNRSYRITDQTTASTPISPLLYSHFIEVGFGYQIAPMQAERFFNRSFEPFFPYNGNTKNSFGLFVREGPYITDWSGEAWYHNGYEHNSWFAAPGVADDPTNITDESTFFINESPVLDVSLEFEEGGCGHGVQSIRVINNETQKWGGVAQKGNYLEQGKSYHFSGFLKSISGGDQIEIRLYPEGNWEKVLFTKEITLTKEYEKYSCEIPYTGPTAEVTFALFIAPQSSIEADAFSLVPADHFYGWKPSAVAAAERVNPGLIRFPGGCFASFYDWKKAVGDPNTRQPEPSFYWGGQNSNDLGTDELGMLCNKMGTEIMLCVNLYHRDKKNYLAWGEYKKEHPSYDMPQFTDPEEGIRSATDWVAYCNLKAGEHPMADWRVKNGYPEPFHVKYWEMENEMHRWFSAEEYANEVVRYSRAMKAIDPDIKIGMISYDHSDKILQMVEIAGKDIDFFADRDDEEEDRLDQMLDIINEYNAANGTTIKYCNTEWQVHLYTSKTPKEEVDERYLYGHKTQIKRAMVLGTWYCGLKAAGYLMNWQRKGGIVDFVNFNNFSNTHGQAVIETPKEGAYLTAPGMVYELLSRSPARWPLEIEGYQAARGDLFQIQAAYSLNRDTLVVYALNRTDSAQAVQFDYSLLGKKYSSVEFTMLDGDDIFARNKMDLPNEIRRKDWAEKKRGNQLIINCPPRSLIQAVLLSR